MTGKSEGAVKIKLHLFRLVYMKNYELQTIDAVEQVVLNSKIALCECKNCAAPIEKKIYFTGVKKPDFYTEKHFQVKKYLSMAYLTLALTVVVVGIIACIDRISMYNNEEYLIEVLLSGESYSSFALIKSEIMESII